LTSRVSRVFIGGDWDADGVVATALMNYAQEKLGVYPLQSKAIVEKKPVDPDRIRMIIGELRGVYDYAVFLDLPYTPSVPRILELLKRHFGVKKIMYIDHHISTINNMSVLEKVVDELIVDKSNPTSVITYRLISEKGIRIPQRLKNFVDLVYYMDSGRRIPDNLMKMFEIVKLISKALTIKRDVELWVKIVDWLSSNILFSSIDESILRDVKNIIDEWDKLVNETAMDLALSAVKIGDFRLIDARGRWKRRGASVLASRLASLLNAPVILWVDTSKEYSLLIIKAHGGRAYAIAENLKNMGFAIDIAGHRNLALIKIPRNVDQNTLREKLYKAIYYL